MLVQCLSLALLGALLSAAPAIAAEEGAFGATSKGEIVITVSVASRVAMSDVKAAAGGAGGDTRSACLWLDTATRGYAVSALDGAVSWHSSATSHAGVTVAPGMRLPNLSSAAAHPDCDRDPALFVGYDNVGGASSRPATLPIAPE